MAADPWGEEDLVAARELVAEIENAELFLYPGDGHVFADSSLGDFDEGAAALLMERTLVFLEGVG
jgi:dienelactone hydrolase